MIAAYSVSDLGLAQRQPTELTDSTTRKRLSPAAIEAFFKIAEYWNLKGETSMALLGGISHGRYYGLKKNHRGVLAQDELTRISLLIGIFKALNILFGAKLANQWVSRPNRNPMFKNAPPLVLMIQAGVPGLLSVRRLLDGRRGGR